MKRLFPTLFLLLIPVSAHQENIGVDLDTGSELGSISWIFVAVGAIIFGAIVLSAIWLIRKPQVNNDNPETYMDKVNLFGMNARLYILHIQGMSLTYGVRTILYNIYLLYVFGDGVTLFGITLEPIFFIGLLLAFGSVVTGVLSPFTGVIVDKLGKKWSFILGDFFGAISILAIIFFQDPWFVMGMQVFRSAVMSVHSIAEGPFIYEQSSAKERVHLFSVSSGMSTLASMSGNLTGGVVPLAIALIVYQTPIVSGSASIFVLQIGLFVSVLLWLLSLVPTFFLKEDPALRQESKHSTSAKLSFKNVTNWGTIGVFTLNSIFIGTGAGLFVSFFSIFFLVAWDASPSQIAVIFALGSLFVALGNFISPLLAEKYGKVRTLVVSRYASILFIVLLPLSPFLLLAGVFYLLRVALMVGTFPTESALSMEMVNDDERVTMEAIKQGGSAFFSAIGFLIGSYYMSLNDFLSPFLIAAVLYFIATTVFWAYFRHNSSRAEDIKIPVSI